ncbi:MAG TPA: YbaK/EbsC family protein, partial [Thermoguttaceae bacterium]|nr:YbaK/EbsC family protein [Thermoguttaceae bacterium]
TTTGYAWFPLGIRMLQKLQHQVRSLLAEAGGQEIGLPILTPVSVWERVGTDEPSEKTGLRLDLAQQERKTRYLLGGWQEPVLADLLAGWLASYRNLPLVLFQMTAVCSAEGTASGCLADSLLRPAVQVYGFHSTPASLHSSYQKLIRQCESLLELLELPYWVARSDSASEPAAHLVVVRLDKGGLSYRQSLKNQSFSTLNEASSPTPTQESPNESPGQELRRRFCWEEVAFCEQCGYTAVRRSARIGGRVPGPVAAASVLTVQVGPAGESSEPAQEQLRCVSTPGARTIAEVTAFLGRPAHQFLKTLLYLADDKPVAILIRGDHEASPTKIQRAFGIRRLEMADPGVVERVTGAPVGFSGPIGLKERIPIWADWDVQHAQNVVVGANQADAHLVGASIGRDFRPDFFADLRLVLPGDPCPECSAVLQIGSGLPAAESVCWGDQESPGLGLRFHDAQETLQPVLVNRLQIDFACLLSAAAAVHHDSFGMVWPEWVAPFDILLLCLAPQNEVVMGAAERLYEAWQTAGVEVLLDDRELRPGVKFYDADLLGVPWQVVLGPKNFEQGQVEVKYRRTGQKETIPLGNAAEIMIEKVQKGKRQFP